MKGDKAVSESQDEFEATQKKQERSGRNRLKAYVKSRVGVGCFDIPDMPKYSSWRAEVDRDGNLTGRVISQNNCHYVFWRDADLGVVCRANSLRIQLQK